MRILGYGRSVPAILAVALGPLSLSSCIEGTFKTTVPQDTPGEADTQAPKDVGGDETLIEGRI